MKCCKTCYRQNRTTVPVIRENIRTGHNAFRCRWCGTLSSDTVAVLDGNATAIINIGTLPTKRWTEPLKVSEL